MENSFLVSITLTAPILMLIVKRNLFSTLTLLGVFVVVDNYHPVMITYETGWTTVTVFGSFPLGDVFIARSTMVVKLISRWPREVCVCIKIYTFVKPTC